MSFCVFFIHRTFGCFWYNFDGFSASNSARFFHSSYMFTGTRNIFHSLHLFLGWKLINSQASFLTNSDRYFTMLYSFFVGRYDCAFSLLWKFENSTKPKTQNKYKITAAARTFPWFLLTMNIYFTSVHAYRLYTCSDNHIQYYSQLLAVDLKLAFNCPLRLEAK